MKNNFENEKFMSTINELSEMLLKKQRIIKNTIGAAVDSIGVPKTELYKIELPKETVSKLEKISSDTKLVSEKLRNVLPNIKMPPINTEFLAAYSYILTDEFREFLKQAGIKLKENLIFNLEILGNWEWCYLGIKESIEEADDSDIFGVDFPLQLKEYLETHKQASIKDIDQYIAKRFTKKTIEGIANKTALNLDTNDAQKLNHAMMDFRARRYFDCANLLAGLIDSQSIKQELLDLKNNKYVDNKRKLSQGWGAFPIVFQNNLSKYFENKELNGKGNKKQEFNKFVEDIKPHLDKYRITLPILNIAYCLLKFFENIDWTEYPNKPLVINRNWLMHGMYDVDDITKSDCIKLLLMLNQLSLLYSKIKKGEL